MEGIDPDFIDFVKKLVVSRRGLEIDTASLFFLYSHCITKK